MSEKELIQYLKEEDNEVLKMVYLENRNEFIAFAQKFCSSSNNIIDAYQDAIIILKEKAVNGDLEHLSCKVKTYLFSIGKYILYDKMRKQKKIIFQQPDQKEAYNYEEMVQHYLEETPNTMQIQLQRAFAGLGKKCKEVLSLFYYRGYSIEEICLAMNYENKNVVKSQKSRCLKQLKDKIKTKE